MTTTNEAMGWLRSKGITMWGGHGWTVTSDDTCKQAAEWFCQQMEEFNSWRKCDGCQSTLIDSLALALTHVIGNYVPVDEQNRWNELLVEYIKYKEANNGK